MSQHLHVVLLCESVLIEEFEAISLVLYRVVVGLQGFIVIYANLVEAFVPVLKIILLFIDKSSQRAKLQGDNVNLLAIEDLPADLFDLHD